MDARSARTRPAVVGELVELRAGAGLVDEHVVHAGAFVEHELSMYHPAVPAPGFPISQLVEWIEKIGAERTVIDSDLGQKDNPLPVDGYLYVVQQLLDHGVKEEAIRQMICRNTAFLLGLEDSPR